jgi:hypothetical protein
MEKKIVLDQVNVEWLISTIENYKDVLTFDFEDSENDTQSRISFARGIVECDNMINFLKEKLN